ncbi:hypothetical protein DGN21_18660 [Xanthomonas sp. MLO165]|nr:hypothetical protein DGN21_18660 [Xanthomonas sp. MLO165]
MSRAAVRSPVVQYQIGEGGRSRVLGEGVGRGCGALTACGTRRESVRVGSLAALMPPRVSQPAGVPH